jgi:heme exporter protein D
MDRAICKDDRVNWGNLDNFLAMGGYGLYVWGSYGVTLVLIAAELILLVRRRRAALERAR